MRGIACSFGVSTVCAVAVACSSFGGTPETGDGGVDASADAPPLDGASNAGSDGGSGEDASVHVDDGFELGPSCGAWNVVGAASATPSPPGRTGARSCLVCANVIGAHIQSGVVKTLNGTLRFSAYVRSAPDPGATNVRITVQTNDKSGRTGNSSDVRALSAEWTRLEATLEAAPGTTAAYIYVVPTPIGCVLVDDVALTLE